MSNDNNKGPVDVAAKFAVEGSEEDSSELAKSLKAQGYDIKAVHALSKDDIWEYLKEAKPHVIVMHNADPDSDTKVISGLFVIDYEAVDKSKPLQQVIAGALGDDMKNDAVHELFVRTTIAGLRGKVAHDVMLSALTKVLGMTAEQAVSVGAQAEAATISKKHLN